MTIPFRLIAQCKNAAELKRKMGFIPLPGDELRKAYSVSGTELEVTPAVIVEPVSTAEIITRSERKLKCYLRKNPKVKFLAQQNTVALKMLQQFTEFKAKQVYYVAQAGDGKTYATCAMLDELLPTIKDTRPEYECGPLIAWFTKKNAIMQTGEVCYDRFGFSEQDLFIYNFEHLRGKKGLEEYVNITNTIVGGEVVPEIQWKRFMQPAIIVADECHTICNPNALITKIFSQYMLTPHPMLLCVSATPASKVSEFIMGFIGQEFDMETLQRIRNEET